MFFMEYKYGKTQSIWEETTEKWDETHYSWKIVGQSPKRILKANFVEKEMTKPSIEHIFMYQKLYYKIIFTSGRSCIGYSKNEIEPGTFVIVEADRGEDCGLVKERIEDKEVSFDYDNIYDFAFYDTRRCPRVGEIRRKFDEFKNIIRFATKFDIDTLESRKAQEKTALEKCAGLVRDRGLFMEITRCEFQWDMKKITFYFKSTKRVDFRELVKELFKFFKIRIWMSMENRKIL